MVVSIQGPLKAVRKTMAVTAMVGASVVALSGAAHAQDTAAEEYAALLEQASTLRSSLTQRQFYLQQQEDAIAALEARINEAETTDVRETFLPIVRNMVTALDEVMTSDLPFRVERRFALLDDIRADLEKEDVSVTDVFRRTLDLYGKEVEYGLSVGSYIGNSPIADKAGRRYQACISAPLSQACDLGKEQLETYNRIREEDRADYVESLQNEVLDGNYIYYGRLSLAYLERDSSEGYLYNPETKSWDKLSNSQLLGLRSNVRIARGESAISTITAPVRITAGAAEPS